MILNPIIEGSRKVKLQMDVYTALLWSSCASKNTEKQFHKALIIKLNKKSSSRELKGTLTFNFNCNEYLTTNDITKSELD